jgi:hypothetical protein
VPRRPSAAPVHVAQERLHEALLTAADGDRARLADLARLLGMAGDPLALPGRRCRRSRPGGR